MSLPEPDEERIRSLGEALVGAPISQIFPARRGANNRVFRIRSRRDDFALKFYPRPDADDPRDRLGAEFAALRFLGGTRTPQAIAADPSGPCGLYEWIEGTSIDDPGPAETDFLASFLADLLEPDGGGHLDVASDAPLRMRVLLDQIAERRRRLGAVPELAEFLETTFDPLRTAVERMVRRTDVDAVLPPELRNLSPSDFGFHNALRRPDGRIVLIDFEYFGWDDPAKTMADAMLHPGCRLSAAMRRHLFGALVPRIRGRDPGFNRRFRVCLRLCALSWCLIPLNLFLREGGSAADRRDRLTRAHGFTAWAERRFARDVHEG